MVAESVEASPRAMVWNSMPLTGFVTWGLPAGCGPKNADLWKGFQIVPYQKSLGLSVLGGRTSILLEHQKLGVIEA